MVVAGINQIALHRLDDVLAQGVGVSLLVAGLGNLVFVRFSLSHSSAFMQSDTS
jgi:hypothetical protein